MCVRFTGILHRETYVFRVARFLMETAVDIKDQEIRVVADYAAYRAAYETTNFRKVVRTTASPLNIADARPLHAASPI